MSETHASGSQVGEVLKSLQQMASLVSQAAADTAQAAVTAGAHAAPPFLAGPWRSWPRGLPGSPSRSPARCDGCSRSSSASPS